MEQRQRGQSIYKVWEVLGPFITYYFTYNAAFLLIAYLCNAAMGYFGIGLQEFVIGRAETVTELVNAISMIIAVLPLIPMLRKELAVYDVFRNTENDREAEQSTQTLLTDTKDRRVRQKTVDIVLTVILAASSSVGLNILLTLTGFVQTSAVYQDVAKQQYGVIFGIGAVLFGLISPITEEIVFRGLVFNRMRRYYPVTVAIIVSGMLFGAYHGNLVQGVYGTCMGILLAYTYERMRNFFVPCLFHAVANLMVYTLAQNAALHAKLFSVASCVVLLIVSAGCIIIVEKTKKSDKLRI